MRVLIAYILFLILVAASIHTCKADDDVDDWDQEISEEYTPPIKSVSSIFKSYDFSDDNIVLSKDSDDRKLIVTICNDDVETGYTCKDLP